MTRAWVALALTAITAVGCAPDDPIGTTDEVVVGVWAEGCGLEPAIGTGVAVRSGAGVVVVTSAHTVAGSTVVEVEHAGARHLAEIVAFDPDQDLAVLRSDAITRGRPLADPVATAAAEVVPWRPDTGPTILTTSITRLLRVTIEDIYVEDEVQRRALEFEGTILPGDSGAPVFDTAGRVVGIVYARSRSREVGFAVSAVEVRAVLDSVRTDPADTGRCL